MSFSYDALCKSYSEWKDLLIDTFLDPVYNYLRSLYLQAVEHAKIAKRPNDLEQITAYFQKLCLLTSEWSSNETQSHLMILKARYSNLQNLIDKTIESKLWVMAANRKSSKAEIDIPAIKSSAFVHQVYKDASKNVGIKYPHYFRQVNDIDERFRNYEKCIKAIKCSIKTTMSNYIISALNKLDDEDKKVLPTSPRRVLSSPTLQKPEYRAPRAFSPELQKKVNTNAFSTKQDSSKTRIILGQASPYFASPSKKTFSNLVLSDKSQESPKKSSKKSKKEKKEKKHKESSHREIVPKEASKREIIPKEASRREIVPKEASRREILKEENRREIIPKEENTTPKEISRREIIPKEESKREIIPKEESRREIIPKEESKREITEEDFKENATEDSLKEDIENLNIEESPEKTQTESSTSASRGTLSFAELKERLSNKTSTSTTESFFNQSVVAEGFD